jgi:hypothetical protein
MGVQQVLDAMASGNVADYRDPHYSNVKFLAEQVGVENLRYSEREWARQTIFSDELLTIAD